LPSVGDDSRWIFSEAPPEARRMEPTGVETLPAVRDGYPIERGGALGAGRDGCVGWFKEHAADSVVAFSSEVCDARFSDDVLLDHLLVMVRTAGNLERLSPC